MNAELELFGSRLLSALVNGTYQGLWLAAIVWLGLKLVPRANAATRHAALFSALLVVALLPGLHFFRRGGNGIAVPEELPAKETLLGQPAETPLEIQDYSMSPAQEYVYEPEVVATRDAVEPLVEISETETVATVISADFPQQALPYSRLLSLKSFAPNQEWRLHLDPAVALGLLSLFGLLACIRLGALGRQYYLLQKMKRDGVPAPEEAALLFRKLVAEAGLNRRADLFISRDLEMPVVAGFARPAVLLPRAVSTGATEAHLEPILRHELAHLSRRDDWFNLAQQIFKAVFFFHPGVLLISQRLTVEREIACDDHVISGMKASRKYALFLTEFAGRMQGRAWAAAPAAWSNKSQLNERITMILDTQRNASPRLSRTSASLFAAIATLAAVLGFYAGPRIALAEQTSPAADPVAAKAQASVTQEPVPEPPSPPPAPPVDQRDVSSQPKPKPGPKAVAGVTAPAKPAVPDVVLAIPPASALPALAAAPPAPEGAPYPPTQPRGKDRPNDSLERRLERLERMVESLVERDRQMKQPGPPPQAFHFEHKGPVPEKELERHFSKLAEEHARNISREVARQAEEHARHALNDEEMNRMHKRIQEDVERAVRDAERAAKDVEQMHEKWRRHPGEWKGEPLKARRQALDAQRKSLQKQLQALEKQIEQIDEEQEQFPEKQKKQDKQNVPDKKADQSEDDKPKKF